MSLAEAREAELSSRSSRGCDHCGLMTRRAPEPSGLVFCCQGCRGAHELIHQWGLEDYYDLREAGEAVDIGDTSYDDLDDPRLLGRSATRPVTSADGSEKLRCKLSIDGLHCAACVWLLEQVPHRVNGWETALVNSHDRTIDLVFDPRRVRLSKIGQSLHRLGYQIAPLAEATLDSQPDGDHHGLLVDIAVAGFCAANAMWVAIAIYAGSFTGMDPSHAMILRFAGVLLGSIAVVLPGRTFFRGAWASIELRTPHMDLPVAIGLGAGLIASLVALFDPEAEIYFDSIASLVFFLLVGRWFQTRQQRRAGDEVAGLLRMAPIAASRVSENGSLERVAVDALQVGDRIVVGPNETLPVDGEVIEGKSLIDRSLLTGESQPLPVEFGDCVEAGTDNVQSTLTVRATAVGEQTRFASIRAIVADAAASRTPTVQLANRIGGWFVAVILVLACSTAAFWFWAEPSRAVPNSVALLIVACPCALALATPLAIAVAIGRLAKCRILIRSGDAMERLNRPGTLFFDKTGTLTAGRMTTTHYFGSDQTLRQLTMIERAVQHPIAKAVVDFAEQNLNDAPETCAHDVLQIPGRGLVANVDGSEIRIGNWKHVWESTHAVPSSWKEREESIRGTSATPIWVSRNKEIIALFGVADRIRDDARRVLDSVRQQGWRVVILSGDDPATVQAVGSSLSIPNDDCRGGCLPEDKLAAVQQAASVGPVVMVGDGVNDAAALAAADVGVAMRGGASASLTAAPVMIADGQLSGVLILLDAARRLRKTIGRNFGVSIAYNLVAVLLAMTGLISPLIAAILMPISSLSVIGMSLASRTIGNHR